MISNTQICVQCHLPLLNGRWENRLPFHRQSVNRLVSIDMQNGQEIISPSRSACQRILFSSRMRSPTAYFCELPGNVLIAITLRLPIRLIGGDHMADPAERAARPDPEPWRDNKPEDRPKDAPIIDLTKTGD